MHSLKTLVQPIQATRFSAVALVLALLAAISASVPAARAEVAIQEVTGESGVTAWLVEDYSVPIVTIRFAFEGGSTQDPDGKEGLAQLMSGLFDEGAGELDSDAFQIRLDDSGAEMQFGAGMDTIYGSMRMLADQKDEAFALLRMAIQQPRFDQGPVDRIRAQMVSGIVAAARDPETAAQTKWREALHGDHPYARPDEGTQESLATIAPDDLEAFHAAVFARENLTVAIVGAIDAAETRRVLDQLFGALPQEPSLDPVAQSDWNLGQQMSVDYDLPQTSLQLAFPGVARDAPDFFAAYLMNEILGGGTFGSRLFEEVREKRGLAYSVGSSLVTQEYSSGLIIGTATRSDRASETLAVIREVAAEMAAEGPTEEELAAVKKFVIGAYAINNLDSSTAIASTLVSLQEDDLGIDYMQNRAAIINGVTVEQVRQVARKLLSAEPAVMIVGPSFEGDSRG